VPYLFQVSGVADQSFGGEIAGGIGIGGDKLMARDIVELVSPGFCM
jgi:hypothetical protein